jgi:hypothetical protein
LLKRRVVIRSSEILIYLLPFRNLKIRLRLYRLVLGS